MRSCLHKLNPGLRVAFAVIFAAALRAPCSQGALLPTPKHVFREYQLDLDRGDAWRVTDPDATHPGAQEFLPNPAHHLPIEDLQHATRAELILDRWNGHPGTSDKRVRFNRGPWLRVPELTTTPPGHAPESFLAQDNPVIDVPLEHLHEGVNRFSGTSDEQITHDFGWGQWGMYGATLRVYYDPQSKPHATGRVIKPQASEALKEDPLLGVEIANGTRAERVDFFARYRGPDTDGDGIYDEWHLQYRRGELRGGIGRGRRVAEDRFEATWNTRFVPDQPPESLELIARIRDVHGVFSTTAITPGLSLQREGEAVWMVTPAPEDIPENFNSRKNRPKLTRFTIPKRAARDLEAATEIALHLRTWNGKGERYFLNERLDRPLPILGHEAFGFADRPQIQVFESLGASSQMALQAGENLFWLRSPTVHHGAEILWPGPVLTVRYPVPEPTSALLSAILLIWAVIRRRRLERFGSDRYRCRNG